MKSKMAIVYGSNCGGCNTALMGSTGRLVELSDISDIVYWPYLMDHKEDDLREIDEVDFGLFIGSVRTVKHQENAELLRAKSKIFVSFGTSACYGGISGLSNSIPVENIFLKTFKKSMTKMGASPSSEQEGHLDGKLGLPELQSFVQPVGDLVDVDIYVPGCPPPVKSIESLMEIIENYPSERLYTEKTIIAEEKSLCEVCPRHKPDEIRLENFMRVHEAPLNDDECFLAQGIVCLGPVTRAGCGSKCIRSNMPCRGCFGPLPSISDQGTRMLTSISTAFKAGSEKDVGEEKLNELLNSVSDPLGLFYLFTLASSIINRRYSDFGGISDE